MMTYIHGTMSTILKHCGISITAQYHFRHYTNVLHYTWPRQESECNETSERNRWRRGQINRGQMKCTVPSRAGRNDANERHGIFDFFLVTIGSSSGLLGNMGTGLWDRTSAHDTSLRLPTNVSKYRGERKAWYITVAPRALDTARKTWSGLLVFVVTL